MDTFRAIILIIGLIIYGSVPALYFILMNEESRKNHKYPKIKENDEKN